MFFFHNVFDLLSGMSSFGDIGIMFFYKVLDQIKFTPYGSSNQCKTVVKCKKVTIISREHSAGITEFYFHQRKFREKSINCYFVLNMYALVSRNFLRHCESKFPQLPHCGSIAKIVLNLLSIQVLSIDIFGLFLGEVLCHF